MHTPRRLVFGLLTFLLCVPAASAQFEKLQPFSYSVWAPQVGAGAVYELESEGKKQVQEIAVVADEQTRWGTGYVLDSYVTWLGTTYLRSTQLRLITHKKKLGWDQYGWRTTNLATGEVTNESSAAGEIGWDRRASRGGTHRWIPGYLPSLDFRRGAGFVRKETVSTPAGDFDCELWRIKIGGALVWYSSRVSPLGLVKVAATTGSVTLTRVITDAKPRLEFAHVQVYKPLTPAATTPALYGMFPGVWKPVVGAGAAYQLESKGIKQEVELVVVGQAKKKSRTLYDLEMNAACAATGFQDWKYVQPYYDSPYWGSDFSGPANGGCINNIQLDDGGAVVSMGKGVFWRSSRGRWSGGFNVLQLLHEARTRTLSVANPSPPAGPLADFRRHAVLVGVEEVATPAGTFQCEHWRSKDEATDVWLSAEIVPLGLVKVSGPSGDLVLTQLIKDAKPRTKGMMDGDSLEGVKLRPKK